MFISWPAVNSLIIMPRPEEAPHGLSIRDNDGRKEIFDPVRKCYVVLSPEEWVRQNFLHLLLHTLRFPEGLIGVETTLKVGKLSKRADIVVYNRKGEPKMLVECKRQGRKITVRAFEQAIRYNLALGIQYIVLTNGESTHCYELDYSSLMARPIPSVPAADIIL